MFAAELFFSSTNMYLGYSMFSLSHVHLVSCPQDDLCILIRISVMIICLSRVAQLVASWQAAGEDQKNL